MSEDIVTRLRNETARCQASPCDCQCPNLNAAADQIERLRDDRDKWKKLADGMAGCLDSSTEAGDLLWEFEQAVRGD